MDVIPFGMWLKFYFFFINVLCDIVWLRLEYNQGGIVALLQRLSSIINKQMEEASQTFTISDVSEAKESLDGTSSHATCHGKHEGRLTLKYMLENFIW